MKIDKRGETMELEPHHLKWVRTKIGKREIHLGKREILGVCRISFFCLFGGDRKLKRESKCKWIGLVDWKVEARKKEIDLCVLV